MVCSDNGRENRNIRCTQNVPKGALAGLCGLSEKIGKAHGEHHEASKHHKPKFEVLLHLFANDNGIEAALLEARCPILVVMMVVVLMRMLLLLLLTYTT